MPRRLLNSSEYGFSVAHSRKMPWQNFLFSLAYINAKFSALRKARYRSIPINTTVDTFRQKSKYPKLRLFYGW